MELVKRSGKQIALGLIAVGLLLTIFSFLSSQQSIQAEIWLDGGDEPVIIDVNNSLAANWMYEAGIRLYPNDNLFYKGISIPYDFKMPNESGQHLVYKPAVPITINTSDKSIHFYSGAATLGEALWENNIFLRSTDRLSHSIATLLDQALIVTLLRSQPVRIVYADSEIEVPIASTTVGEALAEVGLSLQQLDYSIPNADEAIPPDRTIRVIRVHEEVIIEESIIPFQEERVSDPQMNVGEEKILQVGEYGLQTTSARVRFEDGEEVSRIVLAEWISKAPISQRIAYGGNIVEQQIEDMDYWLAMDVYITSYLDTGSPTASGAWPYYGVIAVIPEWYSILKGTSIYVPGYGVGIVLDVCPGCVGKPWIDVFIPTTEYVPWSRTETVYFLSPVPEGFTGELP